MTMCSARNISSFRRNVGIYLAACAQGTGKREKISQAAAFPRFYWVHSTGHSLERLRDAKRVYEKTTSRRARDASQELHHAERPGAPQRRAPLSAHPGTPGRDGGGGVGCQQRRSQRKRRLSVQQAAAAADRWADSLSHQAN